MAPPQAQTGFTDVTARFAEFAAGLRFEALPPDVVTALKHVVLDSLGTALAANTLGTGTRELFDVVGRAGRPRARSSASGAGCRRRRPR